MAYTKKTKSSFFDKLRGVDKNKLIAIGIIILALPLAVVIVQYQTIFGEHASYTAPHTVGSVCRTQLHGICVSKSECTAGSKCMGQYDCLRTQLCALVDEKPLPKQSVNLPPNPVTISNLTYHAACKTLNNKEVLELVFSWGEHNWQMDKRIIYTLHSYAKLLSRGTATVSSNSNSHTAILPAAALEARNGYFAPLYFTVQEDRYFPQYAPHSATATIEVSNLKACSGSNYTSGGGTFAK